MATASTRLAAILVVLLIAAGTAFSQDTGAAPHFGFTMSLGIGVQSFNEPDPLTGSPTTTYQSLGLLPEISFGKFGIGFAMTLNYRFTGDDSSFQVRRADWVPDPATFKSVVALYLPKIMYIRWSRRGDPLFIKIGSFNDGTLGDGFIMGNYDNTLFLPGERHFGFQAGLDGSLFQFPWVGMETVIGNVAAFDVMGVRVYVRPLVGTEIPILRNIELGVMAATDTQPYLGTTSTGTPSAVTAFGGDVRLPIVAVPNVVSLIAFADVASVQGTTWGGMIGVGGRLINIFTYGLQFRVLGDNFIPDYFGPTYDLLRDKQYDIVMHLNGAGDVPGEVGWLASLGTSFLGDRIVFNVSLDAPFAAPPPNPTAEEALLVYPHLRAIFSLAEGLVQGITFDFSYDKKGIANLDELFDATAAVIKAQVNFRTGPAVISFVYNVTYDPTKLPPDDPWVVTSGLQSSIVLF